MHHLGVDGALMLSKCKKALATGRVEVLLRQWEASILILGRVHRGVG